MGALMWDARYSLLTVALAGFGRAVAGAATYDIAMTEFPQQLHRDLPPTIVWGYGGSYPGPTIVASRNEPVVADFPA